MTLVSVVISTYNRPHLLLERSLPSVLAQTHQDLDIVVVGDGTDDKTVEVLRAFPDRRVRFHQRPRQVYPEDPAQAWNVLGLEARNFGMDHAHGDWIAPLDDDDAFTQDHVEILLDAAFHEIADVAYGMSEAHWADGHPQTYGAWPPGRFQYCSGAEIIRASLGYRFDPACIERGLPEDGDMIDRMVAGGARFAFVEQIVHHYFPNRQ